MKQFFIIILIISMLGCVSTIPEIDGYKYQGKVTVIKIYDTYKDMQLSNNTSMTIPLDMTVMIGQDIYKNEKGEILIVP